MASKSERSITELAIALDGKRTPRGWSCRCPTCQQPGSLHLGEDGRGELVMVCFSGCGGAAIRLAMAKLAVGESANTSLLVMGVGAA